MKTIVSLALAAAAAFAASPAAAQHVQFSNDGSYRIAVPYNDLNLASDAGRQSLNGRMRAATTAVCGTSRLMSLNETRSQGACRSNIAEAARPQIALAIRGAGAGVVVAEGR